MHFEHASMAGMGAHAAADGGGAAGALASAADAVDVSTAPLPPLVFQCRACRLAVGDSMDFDCSVRSLSCVALTGASGLNVDQHPQATSLFSSTTTKSSRGADEVEKGEGGAAVAFLSLSCSGCGARLGRRFGERGLPARLARLAGLFCLDVESIASYELGKPELVASTVSSSSSGKQREQGRQREAAAVAAADNATTATTDMGPEGGALLLSSLAARVAELEEELVKVQNVVLGHNEALERLKHQRR